MFRVKPAYLIDDRRITLLGMSRDLLDRIRRNLLHLLGLKLRLPTTEESADVHSGATFTSQDLGDDSGSGGADGLVEKTACCCPPDRLNRFPTICSKGGVWSERNAAVSPS